MEELLIKWTGDAECAPTRGKPGDTGIDLVVADTTRIPVHGMARVPLGISVKMPEGFYAMITGRSSTSWNLGLLVIPSVIDEDYTGPLFAVVQNVGRQSRTVQRGMRIAQLLPMQNIAPWMQVEAVEELPQTERGDSGFGSTGA